MDADGELNCYCVMAAFGNNEGINHLKEVLLLLIDG